ncbi:ComEA family DNA-binding protein [Flavobacterium sp. JP2137]|uniref:ComEA family DNA-binding protein n=1 Tax=Flavobacterium sp. JP2137 TaxID=3414510 RepID=UPI003D2FAD3A
MAILQGAYYLYRNWSYRQTDQPPFDALWMREQLTLDSLAAATTSNPPIQRFNPNFISDYKAYTLGMSTAEIDRLHAFRAQDRFVNSAEEFQAVTQVSDRWLDSVKAAFKFPDWKAHKPAKKTDQNAAPPPLPITIKDINSATRDDLMDLRGVGPVFAERILKERSQLGGFLQMKQLDFIWGLSEECLQNVRVFFDVLDELKPVKTNVNTASLAEINKIPYINYQQARSIVIYRSENGDFSDPKEFENIKNFPLDKLEIISLYLAF